MATGQTLLTLFSLVLLAIVSIGIKQMYVESVHNTIDAQVTSDALNFGRDLAEELHSYSMRYDQLDNQFGTFTDVNNPATRIEYTSSVGETYYATIELSEQMLLPHEEIGRQAKIKLYEAVGSEYRLIAEYVTAIAALRRV